MCRNTGLFVQGNRNLFIQERSRRWRCAFIGRQSTSEVGEGQSRDQVYFWKDETFAMSYGEMTVLGRFERGELFHPRKRDKVE